MSESALYTWQKSQEKPNREFHSPDELEVSWGGTAPYCNIVSGCDVCPSKTACESGEQPFSSPATKYMQILLQSIDNSSAK